MIKRLLLFLALTAAVTTGCGGNAAPDVTLPPATHLPPTATPTPTRAARTPTPVFVAVDTSTPTPQPAPTATDTPAPTPTSPPPTNTPAPDLPIGRMLRDTNIRSGPDTHFPIVGDIAGGQEVQVAATDPSGTWLLLEMPGPGQNWVIRSNVSLPDAQLSIPVATDLPTPPPTPTPGDVVRLYKSSISIPTTPWQQFLAPAVDEETGWDYLAFDRDAYQAANPQPAPHAYQLINLENRWLRVNAMPELGGRVYQLIFKPTGSNEFYQNQVIKPSPWGPGPEGNGWLAAGGIEWGLPVPEHGYAYAEPWGFITLPGAETQAITLFDQHQDTVHLSVTLGVRPDTAAFSLDFELSNESARAIPVSYWTDAMIAPGPANTVSPELRFIYPMRQATVHSTGDPALPGAGSVFDWPFYQGRDLSRLGNWNQWLGFFAHPRAQENWSAIYDPAADEGVVRIFPPNMAPGLKGFGFGWNQPIPADNYTNDGSAYVEMQGGVTPTYEARLTLQPGDIYQWKELWYPVAGIRGITRADARGAVHLSREGDGLHLRLFSIRPITGKIDIRDGVGATFLQDVSLAPDTPADIPLAGMQPPISFELQGSDGQVWKMTELD